MTKVVSRDDMNDNCQIGLLNPKNTGNVGDIIRATGCFGGGTIWYTGTRYERAHRFADAATKHLPSVALKPTEQLIDACPAGFRKVAIELVVGAIPLTEYQHPAQAYYIFGPEDSSLDQATVDACDDVVYIPSAACLNLAASVNVLLYDRSVKLGLFSASDDLVVASRDNRNRLISRA